MPINMNITSSIVVENENKTISLWDLNDKNNAPFLKKHKMFPGNEMRTKGIHVGVKIEFIKKQHGLNYNHTHLILAGITPPSPDEEKERSDLFYYILGIIILIASAFILRQRYKQYLEEKDKLNQ
jgi:hypothetical protein